MSGSTRLMICGAEIEEQDGHLFAIVEGRGRESYLSEIELAGLEAFLQSPEGLTQAESLLLTRAMEAARRAHELRDQAEPPQPKPLTAADALELLRRRVRYGNRIL